MNNIDLLASLASGRSAAGQTAGNDGAAGDFESFFKDFKASLEKGEGARASAAGKIGGASVKKDDSPVGRDGVSSPDKAAFTENENDSASGKDVFSESDAAASIAALILIMTGGAEPSADEEGGADLSAADKLISFIKNASCGDEALDGEQKALLERALALIEAAADFAGSGAAPTLPGDAGAAEAGTDEKPKTILDLMAEYIEAKRKEKSEEEAEKNALEKLTESGRGGEMDVTPEKTAPSAAGTEALESLLAESGLAGELSSGDGLTKLAALIYEFIENVKSDGAEGGQESLFAKAVSSAVSGSRETPAAGTVLSPAPENTAVKASGPVEMSEAPEVHEREESTSSGDMAADGDEKLFPADDGGELPLTGKREERAYDRTGEKSSLSAALSNGSKKTETKIEGAEVKESLRAEAAEKISSPRPGLASAEGESEGFSGASGKGEEKQAPQAHGPARENQFNVFMKEASSGQAAEAKQAPLSGRAYDLKDPSDITRLVKTVESAANKGESKLTVTLTPENMGRLEIRLVESGGKITAKFFTDNESSHKMMISQSEAIKAQLNDKGIVIDNMEFAFTDTASRQGAGEERRAGRNGGNKKMFKNREDGGELGNEIANNKKTGIYA